MISDAVKKAWDTTRAALIVECEGDKGKLAMAELVALRDFAVEVLSARQKELEKAKKPNLFVR